MRNSRTATVGDDHGPAAPRKSRQSVRRGARTANERPASTTIAARLVCPLVLLAVIAAAYANSLSGDYVFDDIPEIKQNQAFRTLSLSANDSGSRQGLPVRPVPYFTFALNYALHGDHILGYHLVNLAIHAGAALLLFGIVRRTLQRKPLAPQFDGLANAIGLSVALLWAVHPLQTQAVTYVYQRMESLMGLLFLATLYAMSLAADSRHPRRWYAVSVGCCACGMASKEVMVVAPLIVLWCDAVFVAQSWHEAVRRRWGYYLALGSTWLILASVLASQSRRYGEFHGAGPSSLDYALTQPAVILHYLSLSFWPQGQCLDYGWPVAKTFRDVIGPLLAIGAMLAWTVWAMARRPALGFLAGSFFLILAPTSSVLPVNDLANEHRMYLPLAALVTGVAVCLTALLKRLSVWTQPTERSRRLGMAAGVGIVVLVLGVTTHLRNRAYASPVVMWNDVVEKSPHNARAQSCLAQAYLDVKDYAHAEEFGRRAVELDPNQFRAHNNLGLALAKQGKADEALTHYHVALRLNPEMAEAHLNLGNLIRRQQPEAAIEHFQTAIRLAPSYAEAHNNLGAMLARTQPQVALNHYEQTLRLEPGNPHAYCNLANLLVRQGRFDEAVKWYEQALTIDPSFVQAKENMGVAIRMRGGWKEGRPRASHTP